jgi:Arc/MetJ family transcription regulator
MPYSANEELTGDVYALHMSRTNLEIEDELIARVMRRYGLSTKRAAVDLALRRLDLDPMTREEALAMRGTGWEGDLDELRASYRGSSAA